MIQQNTPEWLEMRKNKIGASDAPVIMNGIHFGQTPYQLWEEKLDLAPIREDNWAMQEGRRKEDPARQELENITGLLLAPQVVYHQSITWMMASLDCIDPEGKYLAEIKHPGKEDHEMAKAGIVPPHYFPQLQHQIESCKNVEKNHYWSFYKEERVEVIVYRDDKYIKKMIEKEAEFWECLQNFTPPEMTEKDYHQQTSDEWNWTALEWSEIDKQLKSLEKREKQLRDTLINLSQKKNSMGSGVRLSRYIRKGNVDYSLIPELEKIDLEKYRKKPIESYRISSIT